MLKGKPKHVLEAALGFDLDDIEANAHGQITPPQRTRLKRDFAMWLLSNLVLTVIFVLNFRTFQTTTDNGAIGSAVLIFVFAGGFLIWTLIHWVRLVLDLVANKAQAVQGTIRLDVVNRGKGVAYTIGVEGFRVGISKNIFLAFKNNEPYVIYYTPYAKRILSAEWLRPHGKPYEDY
jgi:hypothetical protein